MCIVKCCYVNVSCLTCAVQRQAVFTNLDEDTDYVFHVRAYTTQGAGPLSERVTIHTERDIVRAPMNVQAVATSEQSVEVRETN